MELELRRTGAGLSPASPGARAKPKPPSAIGPALRLYGRVVKTHWPVLLALTVAFPLMNWGASLAWKALPVAPGWAEIVMKGVSILAWGMAWGLIGAVLAQLTLATADRRPADLGVILRACASALPVVALMVLITDATSLPLSLWRSHLATSGQIQNADLVGLLGVLTLPFAVLDAMAFWLLAMAVPIRLDRDLSLTETVKESARLGRKRWRTILLMSFVAGLALVVVGVVVALIGIAAATVLAAKPPAPAADSYLWKAPLQALSMLWLLFWPALYVVFRDQDEDGGVAATFA
ncbi:MAG: hypothetical protein Q7T61_04235 [Caulobacter sp.]|nr:hypothetical protein [Caulobacter sp.]